MRPPRAADSMPGATGARRNGAGWTLPLSPARAIPEGIPPPVADSMPGAPTMQRTATLSIVATSPDCVRYTLVDQTGKRLWITRAYDHEAGHAGARSRLAAFVVRHSIKVVERQAVRVGVGRH